MKISFESRCVQPAKFKCPQCLSDVVVDSAMAGTRTKCPICDANLTVPLSLGHESLFDDLFDDRSRDSAEEQEASNTGIPNGNGWRNDPTVDESRSETKPPTPVKIVAESKTEFEAEIPLSDIVPPEIVSIADPEIIEETAPDENQLGTEDPFNYDEEKAHPD